MFVRWHSTRPGTPYSVSGILGERFQITFHGVRGSTPCHDERSARYGGNTSCVAVSVPGQEPILLDLGTGLRYFGNAWPSAKPFRGTCLLSHLHWDHVQGLPFFTPILLDGGQLDIFTPQQDDGRSVADVLDATICPPLFPVRISDLPGSVSFHEIADDVFAIGEVSVMSRLVPHVGPTCGYRLDWNGASVTYLSDHRQPGVDNYEVAQGALDLCRDVDVLIHDAQYLRDEFALKSTWGHCTVDYAIRVAEQAGARKLVLFHHDPTRGDDEIDAMLLEAQAKGRSVGIEVVAAYEGMTIAVGP